MAWPLAVLGALGAASSIAGIQTGTTTSSQGLLSPSQSYLMARLMSDEYSRMPSYFNTLGNLGQNAENPYSSLMPQGQSFYENISLPMRITQADQLENLTRDPSHQRINKILSDRMKQENAITMNQMKADFKNQNRLMEIQGKDQSMANQLTALGQMKGQFWQPMGVQMMENYYNPGVSPASIISAGASGISALSKILENAGIESRLGYASAGFGS